MKSLGSTLEVAVLHLKNAAGTFTNAFANATTAARTWTFPDKDITVAGISDLSQILHVRDEKATNTNAGSSTAGNNTRVLNTEVTNTISGASLASNQITLPAGTYRTEFISPCFGGGNHKVHLYNVTDSSVAVLGNGCYAVSGTQSDSVGRGVITIASSKVFELRHYITNAVSTFGLGGAGGADGNPSVFATVFIQKIG